jgi:type II secretory pathway pseudopilin PulG
MNKNKKNRKGFSILELILAIFVLTVGITGALKLIVSTIKTSIDTRNSVIASGLAQEGVELLRNRRDNAMLDALSDLSQDSEVIFKTALPEDSNCTINVSGVLDCAPANNNIYLNSDTYSQSVSSAPISSNPTVFKRILNIIYQPSEAVNGTAVFTGVRVISRVWWGSSLPVAAADCNMANKCVRIDDYLAKRD